MKRMFNTAGPCLPGYHYRVPPSRRLPAVPRLVKDMEYVVLYAPQQSGKTTTLIALARELTATGEYAALYFSCETAVVTRDDGAAQECILSLILMRAVSHLPQELRPPWPKVAKGIRLGDGLAAWARACPRPLVLFFDEIDALRGQSLLAVLHQLRVGFRRRPASFPASVVLCGLQDVREYKAAAGGDPTRLSSASPFNVKVASLRLGDFSSDEVRELYGQHTAETGQEFTPAAVDRAIALTAGQPWLANALAKEIVEKMAVPVSEPITVDHVEQAKERLILARATHLDSLSARLAEPRVRRVIEPLITGETPVVDVAYDDDVSYVRDLGLLKPVRPASVANPIYREVIVRVLGAGTEEAIRADPRSFVRPDGRLDFRRILGEFAGFWRAHGEVLVQDGFYHEAAPQLVFMAYLHRVVNGGGYIDREYGVGHGRVDLVVRWPYLDSVGKRVWQLEAVELKVWRPRQSDPTPAGLSQLDEYLHRLGLDQGTLVVFDRRPDALLPADRTTFVEDRAPSGRHVTVLRA